MVTLLRVVSLLVLFAGVGLGVWAGIWNYRNDPDAKSKKTYGLPATLAIIGIILMVILSAAVQIKPTEVGVVENSLSGEIYALDPGTHIWPFSKNVTPFITSVTVYSTMARSIEIGSAPAANGGVSASSSSEGQPLVFFYARGWATINKTTILELHKKYGQDYLVGWVEKLWVTSLKQVQGDHTYDYVANTRLEMETLVEAELQTRLMSSDGVTPLVYVTQLAIVDFDYDEKVNAYLDSVSQMQFQRQQAEMQVEINKQTQEAEKVAAETNYLVTKRNAEAAAISNVTNAQGLADAVKLAADAEAYKILTEADSQAKAISMVQQKLSSMYIQYIWANGWDGKWPNYMGIGGSTLFSIPQDAVPQ